MSRAQTNDHNQHEAHRHKLLMDLLLFHGEHVDLKRYIRAFVSSPTMSTSRWFESRLLYLGHEIIA